MNKVAIALSTKDKLSCTRRSVEPLLQPDKFDLWWFDGSSDPEAVQFAEAMTPGDARLHLNVTGGADAAIVCALTAMLAAEQRYTHVGLVEADVLLHDDWFGSTFALFDRGREDELHVGAVSARAYEDRILVQRDGYAVMHNLGAGMAIFTREAAQIILGSYRTGWAPENRAMFMQLAGVDIGAYWAFRGGEHPLTADWSWDAILARHGLASLALTPSLATMLEQDIAAQNLKMADGKFDLLRRDEAFSNFVMRTEEIRDGYVIPGAGCKRLLYVPDQGYVIFPHQIPGIGGVYGGNWTRANSQGWGPFGWKAQEDDSLAVPVFGTCQIYVSGPGQFRVSDTHSGYEIAPDLPAAGGLTTLAVPCGVSYRQLRIEAVKPGGTFHGIQCQQEQPWLTDFTFDYTKLPPT